MKKRYMIIFMFIVVFFGVNQVSAEEYKCGYYKDNVHLDYTVDGDNITVQGPPVFGTGKYVLEILDIHVDSKYDKYQTTEEKLSALARVMNGQCQKQIYVCDGGTRNLSLAVLFDGQYLPQAKKFSGYINDFSYDFYGSGINNCYLIDIYEETTTGTVVDKINFSCDVYNNYVNGQEENCESDDSKVYSLECYYDKCKQGNSNACRKYNTRKSELQSYCNSIVQYAEYNNTCMEPCIKLNEKVAEIEGSDASSGSCNVSDRIIKWIANILKWIKYIAPVLVIILSILDFIKAIASQSDDEMKKTQGKFVKRLISAALLFLIPFLIQFALEAFNLVSDYCNLI